MQFDIREIKKLITIFKPNKYNLKFYKFEKSKNNWERTNQNSCRDIKAISNGNQGICSNSVVLIEITK